MFYEWSLLFICPLNKRMNREISDDGYIFISFLPCIWPSVASPPAANSSVVVIAMATHRQNNPQLYILLARSGNINKLKCEYHPQPVSGVCNPNSSLQLQIQQWLLRWYFRSVTSHWYARCPTHNLWQWWFCRHRQTRMRHTGTANQLVSVRWIR